MGQEHLRHDDALRTQRIVIQAHQARLTDGRCGLLAANVLGARFQTQALDAQSDGARGHDDHLALACGSRELGAEAFEASAIERTTGAREDAGSDLDDDAAGAA